MRGCNTFSTHLRHGLTAALLSLPWYAFGAQKQVDLQLVSQQNGLHGQYTRFQKTIDGYPMLHGVISVHHDSAGHRRSIQHPNNKLAPQQLKKRSAITQTATAINAHQAEQIALQSLIKQAMGKPVLTLQHPATKLWYPTANGLLQLGWKILIAGDNPLGDFVLIINAQHGNIVLQQNQIKFFQQGRGAVFQPNPVQSTGLTQLHDNNDSASTLLNAQRHAVLLSGLSDHDDFLLTGQFVDVASLNTINRPQNAYPDARQTNRRYIYDRHDPRFEQVMVYHTIDAYQRYLQALGFNDNNPTPNGIRHTPIRANAHWDDQDRSMYRSSSDTLHFGDGGVDDAEDADIILHEYGHAIQYAQNPELGCQSSDDCEMLAMSEGFSDYIAADFHARQGNIAYQKKHAACVGEWDSISYSDTVPTCLRRVDSNKKYPKDLIGEKYADSALWSRTLWDIRAALGSNIANQIILEHHYGLATDSTMPMAARQMLAVDTDLFGGFHQAALRKVFCTRGILTHAFCTPTHTKTIIRYPSKDSFIEQAAANINQGLHTRLKVSGQPNQETRTVLGFNLHGIAIKKIKSAILELSIASSDNQWDTYGHTVDIHPLHTDFPEGVAGGNYALNRWPWLLFKTMPGVTWACAKDSNIINNRLDCPSVWSGGHEHTKILTQGSSVPVVQTNHMTGKVRWTVSNDVKAGYQHWLIKTTFPGNGHVEYYSKEAAQQQHAPSLSPRLIISFR